MEHHDPEEGSSSNVPRFRLERGARGRLGLVSDIETVEGDNYRNSLRPQSSIISTDSSVNQYTPPGTSGGESVGRSFSFGSGSRPQPARLAPVSDREATFADSDGDADTFGVGSVPVSSKSNSNRRHSDSVHTESSYGVTDLEGPKIVPGFNSPAGSGSGSPIPPPIPIKDQKRAMRRPSSINTASSYALYTPRTPGNKQVRFSEDSSSRYATTPGAGDIPPLPPHAVESLRTDAKASAPKHPHYFYGPPPLHGDDISPPIYNKQNTALADDDEGLTWSEKVHIFDPNDDPEKPWWKRKKGYCFWIILALAALTIVFAVVVGAVVGIKMSKGDKGTWSPAGNETDFPPPGGFLGTWGYTTKLENTTSSCAPTAEGASTSLWRCFPFQEPPSTSSATWSFVISGEGDDSRNVQQLMISSSGNPFQVNFAPQPLNLTRYITNAYYQFNVKFTKTSIVTINGRIATCEFPNTILTGTLYVNNTIFEEKNAPYMVKPALQSDVRGEWPGDVVISEEKFGGGRQVVCRDRGTADVIPLEDLTDLNGNGNCLCNYQNFDVPI